MSGELITSFRPEVQAKILSYQDKYNPNHDAYIDEKEIGALLKEFGATNIKDLQQAKGIADKVSDYVFPKVDVYPAAGEGYVARYTDGDETYITKDHADAVRSKGIDRGGSLGGGLTSIGAGGLVAFGLVHSFEAASEVTGTLRQVKRFGKFAGMWGLGAVALGFLAKKCFNSAHNDETIVAKLDMLKRDETIQAEKKKQEEELRQRQEAMKQSELEYRERLSSATSGIENNIKTVKVGAHRVNTQLKKANTQVDSLVAKTKQ